MSGRQAKLQPQEFRSFRALGGLLPATKIGVVVALLPEIRGLQQQGHKTRAIWESLQQDGLGIGYDLFRLYLRRARRKLNARRLLGESSQDWPGDTVGLASAGPAQESHPAMPTSGIRADPFAGIRRSLKQKAKERFEYDPLAPLKEDLLR
jgi:hypothetical protein